MVVFGCASVTKERMSKVAFARLVRVFLVLNTLQLKRHFHFFCDSSSNSIRPALRYTTCYIAAILRGWLRKVINPRSYATKPSSRIKLANLG